MFEIVASYPFDEMTLDFSHDDTLADAAENDPQWACCNGGVLLDCRPRRELGWKVRGFQSAQIVKGMLERSGVPGVHVTMKETGDMTMKTANWYWWKFVHNFLIHPLLAFPWELKWVQRAHDWTAKKCWGGG